MATDCSRRTYGGTLSLGMSKIQVRRELKPNRSKKRFSSAVLHVEAITTLWGFLRQIAEYQQTRTPRVTYRLKGSIYSGSPNVKLPFDDSGEFNVPIEPTQ